MPLDIVNSQQTVGAALQNFDLIYSHTVPITTSIVPAAAESAYLAFKNDVVNLETKMRTRSYVPYYQTGGAPNFTMVRAPLLDATNVNIPGYG